ncbi:hypothetical protein TorRG33x02_233200 [Trema orientale]|uniref:Uncharacterized protein n=1 Tax=Trema orientale TaxID=63057 RepID=A0A2P5E5V1_TREOI|nr:hypothetical protein TorRG33x02_233200 [Trema orientale]
MGIKKIARKASKVAKFNSDKAETRFKVHIRNRPLGTEKGFVLDNTKSMGYPPFIVDVIIQHNWQLFCAHPEDPIVALVHKFYANLTDPEEDIVYVRGVQVPLSEEAINVVFGLEDPMDGHLEFV